ncbi:cupin domain-containing protein [Bacillus sp. ISL-35]|uniref:cupin domain-containing protein n=1 Tax=Bacillus sp. ISL-35 TaxID=2819122 RepID=UPI001BE6BFFA|nr:cupin domain-containing protein [Bacillus sp. ISL-35]MBT2704464.1 cupin domain-containing protein [Chryseobacterium sp. ISL-80]
MEFYNFKKDIGVDITKFDSNFVMSRIVRTVNATHIGFMYLDQDGIIGFHQATMPQLLLVVSGSGVVRGESEEYYKVEPGTAVFWRKGEWHETKTDKGLTAVVIESEELNPASYMAKLENYKEPF